MKASEWIDRVKIAHGWESDYRVAKELGFRPNTISQYRSHGGTLDEVIALKVAKSLGEQPEMILLDQAMERSKNDEARGALQRVLARLGGIAAGVLVAVGVGGTPAPAAASQSVATDAGLYIMFNRRKPRKAKRDAAPKPMPHMWPAMA